MRVTAEFLTVDSRKLRFAVAAHGEYKQVGAGTRRRAIVKIGGR